MRLDGLCAASSIYALIVLRERRNPNLRSQKGADLEWSRSAPFAVWDTRAMAHGSDVQILPAGLIRVSVGVHPCHGHAGVSEGGLQKVDWALPVKGMRGVGMPEPVR